VVGLILGLAFLVVASVLQASPVVSGSWESPLGTTVGLPAAVVLVACGYVVGAALATRFPLLARPFRTRGEMLDEVRRRAADCFTDFRLRDAQGAGVLVYVSLLERLVWITADDALAAKLEQGDLEGVRDEVVGGLRRGSLADGLVAGVARAAQGVAALAPPAATPAARVPNTVREV
jgi:putative membrane protein